MGITRNEKKREHLTAIESAKKHAEWESTKKIIKLPHPSGIRNTWILKYL